MFLWLSRQCCGCFLGFLGSVPAPDPRQSQKPVPDPLWSEKSGVVGLTMGPWRQIRDRLDEESDTHQIEKSDPDPHQIEMGGVQIRIQLKSRIRIRITFSRSGSWDLSFLLSIPGKFWSHHNVCQPDFKSSVVRIRIRIHITEKFWVWEICSYHRCVPWSHTWFCCVSLTGSVDTTSVSDPDWIRIQSGQWIRILNLTFP